MASKRPRGESSRSNAKADGKTPKVAQKFQESYLKTPGIQRSALGDEHVFCVYCSKDISVKKKNRLRVGLGYNRQTGVFTAPVSGTYCFMVNSSPRQADNSKKARLAIVLEDSVVGYVFCSGDTMSTGHTAVKMDAGQRVWLRTYNNREYVFNAGWWTYFSGMLLQPDV